MEPPKLGNYVNKHPRVWQLPAKIEKQRNVRRCRQCGVLYQNGRWSWHVHEPKEKILPTVCPACQQINNHKATGFLALKGDYFQHHRDEILNLVRHATAYECEQHPLNRLIGIERIGTGINLRFTDMHLPKKVGHAIKSAHAGQLKISYDGSVCKAFWQHEKSG